MFNWIWENRSHVSEISGKPLYPKGHSLWHFQFLHVLSKGAYPSYKLNPDNILLGTPEEHQKQESFQIFQDKKDLLKSQYYNERRIKTFVTGKNPE